MGVSYIHADSSSVVEKGKFLEDVFDQCRKTFGGLGEVFLVGDF